MGAVSVFAHMRVPPWSHLFPDAYGFLVQVREVFRHPNLVQCECVTGARDAADDRTSYSAAALASARTAMALKASLVSVPDMEATRYSAPASR